MNTRTLYALAAAMAATEEGFIMPKAYRVDGMRHGVKRRTKEEKRAARIVKKQKRRIRKLKGR